MKMRFLTAAALSCALITAASLSALAGETTVKTVHMGDNEIEVEVTDIGKSGSFTYWSAFTGDSADWEQKRVDAFNEAYADLGISVEVQYVPDGAGINNGKLLSAIAGGTAPDLLISDNPTSAYQYAAEGSLPTTNAYLGLHVLEIITSLMRSAETGECITLSETGEHFRVSGERI